MTARHSETVSIFAVLCYTCAALAQQAEETVLRVTTRLVQVSVVAHDRDGNPVRDLTRDDFTLTDNGLPQPISVFSVQVAEPAESAPDQEDAANPLVISNRTLRPGDPVALYSINGPQVHVIHDFTDDSASLIEAAQKLSRSPILHNALAAPQFSLGSDHDRTAQLGTWLKEKSREDEAARLRMTTEWTLTALADVAHHLTGIPGRNSLLWISESFPITIGFDIHSFTQGGARRANQQLDLYSARERDLGRRLTDAQVAVYPISPSGVVADPIYGAGISSSEAHATFESWTLSGHMVTAAEEAEPGIAAMSALANETGGLAFHNANGVSASIRRAIQDASVSYILGFYPPGKAWDGEYHEIGI